MRPSLSIARTLALGLALPLAACVAPAPAPVAPAQPPSRPDRPEDAIQEIRYVEASGPPKQDPERRPAPRVEDPQDPAVQLEVARRELEHERTLRATAEQRLTQLQTRLRDLEARILSLSLERARFEQEVLQLRIDALRAELTQLEPGSDGAPKPDGGR